MAAGALEDVLAETGASSGRPLVVCPATRPDVILGLGAAQVQAPPPHPTHLLLQRRPPPLPICSVLPRARVGIVGRQRPTAAAEKVRAGRR